MIPTTGSPNAPAAARRRALAVGACALALLAWSVSPRVAAFQSAARPSGQPLTADLDRIFADPLLSRALMAVRVESLRDGHVLYAVNDDKLVMPASNMKIVTMAAAAERLGWNFTYETTLEAAGSIAGGVLHGDLIATGGGDPSIGPIEDTPAPLFTEWAAALAQAGIRKVDGRLIGDDHAFDNAGLGAGWTWDDLGAGYASPAGALSYNENAVTLRIRPGRTAGDPAAIEMSPDGHQLELVNEVRTGPAGSEVQIDRSRRPGEARLFVRGSLPAGGAAVTRTASIDNPTKFFTEALRLALLARGIRVEGGSWDLDDVASAPPSGPRRLIAQTKSPPLSTLSAYLMKESQNFYAETVLRTLGRAAEGAGTVAAGRQAVLSTLGGWGVPTDALVISDGSGLSRYNYVTAGAIVTILKHLWQDESLRGSFAASLPVAGHDGTLETRMRGTALDARLEAKTGTISNVRALSGYLETQSGERLVLSMIANHFTATSSQIDAIVERALARLAQL